MFRDETMLHGNPVLTGVPVGRWPVGWWPVGEMTGRVVGEEGAVAGGAGEDGQAMAYLKSPSIIPRSDSRKELSDESSSNAD